ncbi:pilus (MSHA type) biogenesis protein MshL [Catenovulum agarivorans DS-2]|uniref:Pilus (MSHA type) biogenesis protein MshL n=1 Tax=Catenovulum agarivorans DS-2 TaxID=1328313 RepID=W7QKW9_9ALTE|nr:pilus (MSHA type) biogenesis protein MshL [Catenovulum agarivorans]EWH08743.1 pilus (MSHA type) biogenesis protein MshL [Catenovulum agarivorans DS-2]
MRIKLSFSFVVTLFLLVGCQSRQLSPDIEKALNSPKKAAPEKIPDEVWADLTPQLSQLSQNPLDDDKRYDIEAQAVAIEPFFRNLVAGTALNLVVHPSVTGELTLALKGVTLAEVVEIVKDIYGYDIRLKGRLLQIFPAGMRTETISVDYLAMQRFGASFTSITSGGVSNSRDANSGGNNSNLGLAGQEANQNSASGLSSNTANGTTIVSNTQNDFWTELKSALNTLLTAQEGRSIIVNPQAGLVTVRAFPDEIRSIRQFLSATEQQMQRQVILEAKVIEVSLNDGYQQGIEWETVLGTVDTTTIGSIRTGGSIGDTITNVLGGITSLSFNNGDFAGLIRLLETQGNVQVLSSPRLTAANNQKAVIKVGTDEYFVTEVSTTTVTGTATTSTPNIELEPFFSGIALDVTPQINADGQVILHVHPSVIDTSEQVKVVTLDQQNFTLPLAQSNVRESDTIIKANSGEIVVIGGLMQTIERDNDSKTPILGDIPVLGELFKSKSTTRQKKELIIMIKPTVVGKGTWQEQLQRSSNLLKQWYQAE